jgi:UrcA family protein
MTIINRAIIAAVVPLVALAAPMASASEPAPAARTLSIRYNDLDLTTAQGQAALRERVQQAALDVCHSSGPQYDDVTFMRQVECMRSALHSANAQASLAIESVATTAPRMAFEGAAPRS